MKTKKKDEIEVKTVRREPNSGSNFSEWATLLSVFVPLVVPLVKFLCDIIKNERKAKTDKSVYDHKCEKDIEKAQAIHDIKTQGYETNGHESAPEEEETIWEDFNNAVYGHISERHFWLVGNVINMGGIHLIFGTKSIGKTIFVTTLANAISKGEEFRLLVSDGTYPCCQPPQMVYLYDLEMGYSDLNKRNGKHSYAFSNIMRCDGHNLFTVESWLRNVEKVIDGFTCNATIILDNVTRLESNISQPIFAKRLFDGVKSLRDAAKEKGIVITFILVAHTTNNRNDNDPVTLKDLACADSLTTGMDSISIIGPTLDPEKILYKALCLRHAPIPTTVTILERNDEPFMRFEVVGTDEESNVMPIKKSSAKAQRISKSADNASG